MSEVTEEQVSKYKEIVGNGVDGTVAAELTLKQASCAEGFFNGLALMVDALIDAGEVEAFKLSAVQLMLHRHIKKIFGETTLFEVLATAPLECPVRLDRSLNGKFYVIKRKDAESARKQGLLAQYKAVRREIQIGLSEMTAEGRSIDDQRAYTQLYKDKHGITTFSSPDGPPDGEVFKP